MLNINSVITEVGLCLNDANHDRWTEALLLSFFNDAVNIITSYFINELSQIKIMKARQGEIQKLDKNDNGRILDILGQTDNEGNLLNEITPTPSNTIDRWTDTGACETCETSNRYEAQTYKFDRSKKEVILYPPVPANVDVYLKVLYQPDITSLHFYSSDAVIPSFIKPIYLTMCKEWMIYKAFNCDLNSQVNPQIGVNSYNTFWKLIAELPLVDKQRELNNETRPT